MKKHTLSDRAKAIKKLNQKIDDQILKGNWLEFRRLCKLHKVMIAEVLTN